MAGESFRRHYTFFLPPLSKLAYFARPSAEDARHYASHPLDVVRNVVIKRKTKNRQKRKKKRITCCSTTQQVVWWLTEMDRAHRSSGYAGGNKHILGNCQYWKEARGSMLQDVIFYRSCVKNTSFTNTVLREWSGWAKNFMEYYIVAYGILAAFGHCV